MSLAERLSVMEEYESLRDPSPVGAARRKMSFNPLPAKWVPLEENAQPVGAFEVSSTKRTGRGHSQLVAMTSNLASIADSIFAISSPGYCCRCLLPICCGHCLWICRYQTECVTMSFPHHSKLTGMQSSLGKAYTESTAPKRSWTRRSPFATIKNFGNPNSSLFPLLRY